MRMRTHQKRAFTIIELLVAVSVTALMVGLMLSIVVNVLKGWDKSSGSLTAGNQARVVLDQLARDLQSSIMKRDRDGWLVATVQQDQNASNGGRGDCGIADAVWVATKPSGASSDPSTLTASFVVPTNAAIDDYRFGQGGVWLRFISTCSDTNDGSLQRISAPRAVAYQIVRLPVVANSSEVRYQLYRSEVRPGHATPSLAARSTFRVGYDFLSPTSLYNTPDNPAGNFGVTGNDGGEPGSIRRPDRNDHLIANNVIDFGVRFWASKTDRNNDGKIDALDQELVFPTSISNTGFAATTSESTTAPGVPLNQMSYGFPEVAEVFVRILTDQGVNEIASLENGLRTGNWWEIALANSRVYVRRIEFKTSL